MSSSLTTEAPAAVFACACDAAVRSACAGLPFFKSHGGMQYCVLHYPDEDKGAVFAAALKAKHDSKDFNFRGVWFPDAVDFSKFRFDSHADFRGAKFRGAANFNGARFNAEASFTSAEFHEEAYFRYTTFEAKSSFRAATFFKEASFTCATFRAETYFIATTFTARAYFGFATFKGSVRFSGTEGNPLRALPKNKVFGDESSLKLTFARIETPERFSFHTLRLRPHWFVNVDARKFEFINVDWDGRKFCTKRELKSLKEAKVPSAHRLLSIACRNLALNAEENHHYEDASGFRYMAMDARRLESWRGFHFLSLGWWYWLASGYGERVGKALVVLLVVWLFFAVLYTRVGFSRAAPRSSGAQEVTDTQSDAQSTPLPLRFALHYSLAVMALQKPEPRPTTNTAHSFVLLETILGPLQAALLALALRRKFMR